MGYAGSVYSVSVVYREFDMSHGWFTCSDCGEHYHDSQDHNCKPSRKSSHMSETFKPVPALMNGDLIVAMIRKPHNTGPWFAADVLQEAFTYEQACALRDWLNKALEEPQAQK